MRSLLAMARAYHAEMNAPWPFDPEAFLDVVEAIRINGFFRLTDKGFIAGAVNRNPLNPEWRVGTQIMWYGDADLIRQFRKWAKAQGVNEIHCSCKPETRVERFYSSFAQPCDAVYSEVI
ncbi:hypothetical protein [Ruegeria sp. HKCCD6109]|uniref:hypothetical protein n=1 Tax=Ruegeria sp. HKCCD6109 TaxID=2683017 RepID=UPI001492F4E3|nr:hypothetical protein [Ruegeria sp. HKCCD6109]